MASCAPIDIARLRCRLNVPLGNIRRYNRLRRHHGWEASPERNKANARLLHLQFTVNAITYSSITRRYLIVALQQRDLLREGRDALGVDIDRVYAALAEADIEGAVRAFMVTRPRAVLVRLIRLPTEKLRIGRQHETQLTESAPRSG